MAKRGLYANINARKKQEQVDQKKNLLLVLKHIKKCKKIFLTAKRIKPSVKEKNSG